MISFFRRYFNWRCAPGLAFAGTVVLGYVSSLWDHSIRLTNRSGQECLAFGVIYALLGTIDYTLFRINVRVPARIAYLCLQGALLMGIIYTSRLNGEIPICVFPMVAVTAGLLDNLGATIGCTAIYGAVLAVEGHFYGFDALLRWSVSMLPSFGFVVIFTRMAVREKSARHRAEELSAEVEKLAVIQERNRLAREIHDSLGHFLTTIHVQLQAAQAVYSSDPGRALEAVAKAESLARDALVEVRRSVGALHADRAPPPLAASLRDLASATDGWGTTVSLEILGDVRTLAPETEHALFRAAQEGLTNVRKHARAKNARVALDYRDPKRIFVRVTDDGCGGPGGHAGHGLAGLGERVGYLGGRVVAENLPEGGFLLEVEIPA